MAPLKAIAHLYVIFVDSTIRNCVIALKKKTIKEKKKTLLVSLL